jgi:hypothetical protein
MTDPWPAPITPEMRLAALIVVQLCLTMQVYARGTSSLLMLPQLRAALPVTSEDGSSEKMRMGMQRLIEAQTSLDWHLAQEEARKAVMPILRTLTGECLAEVPDLLRAG